jgi:hypothetical protein
MSNIETISLNYYILAKIEKEATYSSSIREEECHGFHTFVDQEELSNDIVKVCIKIGDKEIDVTKRLTKEELNLLEMIDTDEIEIDEDRV